MSEYEGFVERQGPKQVPGPNDDMPALARASDLLDEEEPIRQEEPDDETPPDSAAPTFIVVRNAFGPGAHSVKYADGTPVGVYINERDMTPEAVEEMLTSQGLDADLIAFFTRNRGKARTARDEIMADPRVVAFAAEEDRRKGEKADIQAAFIKAWKEKKK